MTCKEFRRILDNPPEMATNAEAGAAFRHREGCNRCRKWLKRLAEAEDKRLTPSERAIIDEQAASFTARICSDPETGIVRKTN